jgi:hypothetical protein
MGYSRGGGGSTNPTNTQVQLTRKSRLRGVVDHVVNMHVEPAAGPVIERRREFCVRGGFAVGFGVEQRFSVSVSFSMKLLVYAILLCYVGLVLSQRLEVLVPREGRGKRVVGCVCHDERM